MSKRQLSTETLVHGDFCPRKLLQVMSLLKSILPNLSFNFNCKFVESLSQLYFHFAHPTSKKNNSTEVADLYNLFESLVGINRSFNIYHHRKSLKSTPNQLDCNLGLAQLGPSMFLNFLFDSMIVIDCRIFKKTILTSNFPLGQKSTWTDVSLDKSLLEPISPWQKSSWTNVPWTWVSLDKCSNTS